MKRRTRRDEKLDMGACAFEGVPQVDPSFKSPRKQTNTNSPGFDPNRATTKIRSSGYKNSGAIKRGNRNAATVKSVVSRLTAPRLLETADRRSSMSTSSSVSQGGGRRNSVTGTASLKRKSSGFQQPVTQKRRVTSQQKQSQARARASATSSPTKVKGHFVHNAPRPSSRANRRATLNKKGKRVLFNDYEIALPVLSGNEPVHSLLTQKIKIDPVLGDEIDSRIGYVSHFGNLHKWHQWEELVQQIMNAGYV